MVIAVGMWNVITSGGPSAPGHAAAALPAGHGGSPGFWLHAQGLFLRLHGDDGRRGGEQRRDGLPRPDTRKNAQDHTDHHHRSAGILLLGIALLCRAYGVAATDPDGSTLRERALHADPRRDGPRMVLLLRLIGSTLLVLALSANTAFADFPRLTRAIALNDLSAPCLSAARAAAALLLGNLCAGWR
jgi:hypothetical protein